MPIHVQCPKCQGMLPVTAPRARGLHTCPRCGESFRVSPWAAEQEPGDPARPNPPGPIPPPPSLGLPAAPDAPTLSMGGAPPLPADPRAAKGPPPPAQLPATTGNVARFVTPETATESEQMATEGDLPELRLRETEGEVKKETPSFVLSPALLSGVLCLSLVLSVALLLVDTGQSAPTGTKHATAAAFVKDYYLPPTDLHKPGARAFYLESLFPEEFGLGKRSAGDVDLPRVRESGTERRYVEYLRNAMLAREKGNSPGERLWYRRTLRLLRQQPPPGVRDQQWSVTETRDKDEILEKVIAVLLSEG